MYNEELYHYGIPGMRWGVRRYRNKDGSLTKKGRKRAAELRSELDTLQDDDQVESKYVTIKASPKKLRDMSDSEINALIERRRLEERYKELFQEPVVQKKKLRDSYGAKFVSKVLDKSATNIATQLVTYAMGDQVNKLIGQRFFDDDIVNPKKGQKDK